jgi:hypothetical protein
VAPGQGAALLVGGLAGHAAYVAEVAEVLGARPRHLLRALFPLPVDLHDDEAERGEEEHAGGDEAAAAATPARTRHRRHQHDRAQAAEHRDGVHHHARRALVGLDLRRRLEHQLSAGHLRLVVPGSAKGGTQLISPLVRRDRRWGRSCCPRSTTRS